WPWTRVATSGFQIPVTDEFGEWMPERESSIPLPEPVSILFHQFSTCLRQVPILAVHRGSRLTHLATSTSRTEAGILSSEWITLPDSSTESQAEGQTTLTTLATVDPRSAQTLTTPPTSAWILLERYTYVTTSIIASGKWTAPESSQRSLVAGNRTISAAETETAALRRAPS